MKITLNCIMMSVIFLYTSDLKAAPSKESVIENMIQKSISQYPGNCPCPYSLTKRGYKCGKRSAYLRPGGYAPLCYKRDVTKKMIKRYLKNNR